MRCDRLRLLRRLAPVALTMFFCCGFTLMPSAGTNNARWRDFPIVFNVNYAHSPYSRSVTEQALSEALWQWNTVTGSRLQMQLGEETFSSASDLMSGRSYETAIVFDPEFERSFPKVGKSVLAVGTATRIGDRYVQGLIVINASALGASLPVERFKVIVAHEAGHTVGLGHSSNDAALMYSTVVRTTPRLADDDALGVMYLYPTKEGLNAVPFGCGRIERRAAGARSRSVDHALGWLALFCLGWAMLRCFFRAPQARFVSRSAV